MSNLEKERVRYNSRPIGDICFVFIPSLVLVRIQKD